MTDLVQNLTSEQSTTSNGRGSQHTDMSGGDEGSGLCENAPRPFQMVSLLPESILDLIRSLLFMCFKDEGPGFRDFAWASKERKCVFCERVCVCVGCVCLALWLRSFCRSSWLEGCPDGSLCDLLVQATVLTCHLQRSGPTTKTDNCWKISQLLIY